MCRCLMSASVKMVRRPLLSIPYGTRLSISHSIAELPPSADLGTTSVFIQHSSDYFRSRFTNFQYSLNMKHLQIAPQLASQLVSYLTALLPIEVTPEKFSTPTVQLLMSSTPVSLNWISPISTRCTEMIADYLLCWNQNCDLPILFKKPTLQIKIVVKMWSNHGKNCVF